MNTPKCAMAVLSLLMLMSHVFADEFEYTEIFVDQILDGSAPIVVPFDLGPLYPQGSEEDPNPDPIWTPVGSVAQIGIQISHTNAGDVEFSVTSPDGQVFQLSEQSANNGNLGINGTGESYDTDWYVFAPPATIDGATPPWGNDPALPTSGEVFYLGEAISWGEGPFIPQGWTFEINDVLPQTNNGYVMAVAMLWQPAQGQVPEPSVAMILPVVLIGYGFRRRR